MYFEAFQGPGERQLRPDQGISPPSGRFRAAADYRLAKNLNRRGEIANKTARRFEIIFARGSDILVAWRPASPDRFPATAVAEINANDAKPDRRPRIARALMIGDKR